MIDYIDEIDCCVKSDIADGCAKDVYGYTTVERMGELIARLRQAEKDAVRYRWLRDDANGVQVDGCLQLCGEDCDLAIDRVMKCEQ